MAPFLVNFFLSRKAPKCWISLISFLSFLLQLATPKDSIFFGIVFSRIWQFLFGSFVFAYNNIKQEDLRFKSVALEFDSCITYGTKDETQSLVDMIHTKNEKVF